MSMQFRKKGKEMARKATTKEAVIYGDLIKTAEITIEGTGDIILNKMNISTVRELTADDRKAQHVWEQQHMNKWERIITSIHWRDPLPTEDTNSDCSEEMMMNLLNTNAPCIPKFGFNKSWGQAVVRFGIDKYSTKFDPAVDIAAPHGLIPITFDEWHMETKLMAPKRGAPVTQTFNHFSGWGATILLNYTDDVYSLNEILTVISKAGMGLGIGSGRSSGYGRYKIVDVK